jgi:hypothetical protein
VKAIKITRLARLFLILTAVAGCHSETNRSAETGAAKPKSFASTAAIKFRGQELPFVYERGETGAAWPVETTGGGVGVLDFDGDGRLDLFFAQGGPLPPGSDRPNLPADVLLRNLGEGRFEDVSERVRLAYRGYGQGVAVADFDGDGDPDIYVTRYGRNTLWRNDRDKGTFADATDQAGIGCGSWSLGAAFADFDGDGDLDLFVVNYFAFDPSKAPFRRNARTGAPEYGLPQDFLGLADNLFRNDGNGHFTDVTARAGVAGAGRGMGVLAADLDGDGRIDWLVANDAHANNLWRNRGDGTFEDVAEVLGVAVNGQGLAEANMGIAFGDTDANGLLDIIITHFYGEHTTLWHALNGPNGTHYYQDATSEAGLAVDSRVLTGWGTVVADFDHDGLLDLIQTNGHIRPEPAQLYRYDNPPILWRNQGDGRFANVSSTAGLYFQSLHMGRGLASGDLDNDGDLDLVVVHHHAPSVILWNESPGQGNYLKIKLRGAGQNRDGIGAIITATINGQKMVRTIAGGGSYISASDTTVHFGLGTATIVDRVELRWPSGKTESRSQLPVNATIEWTEPGG